ncbi:MAG TPA: hypothetical protein VGF26_21180 [Ramlibacter sp.]
MSLVNTVRVGDQVFALADRRFGSLGSIGALPDGGYTVAWAVPDPDPRHTQVPIRTSLQRYDNAGAKVGGEISFTALNSELAVLRDGGLVAVHLLIDADQQRVAVSRFDANGMESPSLAVGAMSSPPPGAGIGSDPHVAALSDGGFVVSWRVFPSADGFQVITQRFDSQGKPVGDAMQFVGPDTNGTFNARNAVFDPMPDAHGGYTVSVGQPGGSTSFLAHVDANGTVTRIGIPGGSAGLLLPLQGRFVLFTSNASGSFLQFLDSAGHPSGDPIALPAMPVDARDLADGGFVMFFNSGAGTITAQRADSSGARSGDLVTLGSGAVIPGIAALTGGGFAAAWSMPSAGGDQDVFTQRVVPVPK